MLNLHVVVTKVVRCLHLSWRHLMFSLFLFDKAMLERLKPGMSSVCLSCNSSTCFLLEFSCEGGPIHCLNAMNEVVLPFAKMICYHGSTLSTRPTMDDKQIKHQHHGIKHQLQLASISIQHRRLRRRHCYCHYRKYPSIVDVTASALFAWIST